MTCFWCGYTSDEVKIGLVTKKPFCKVCNYVDANTFVKAKALVDSKIIFIKKDK